MLTPLPGGPAPHPVGRRLLQTPVARLGQRAEPRRGPAVLGGQLRVSRAGPAPGKVTRPALLACSGTPGSGPALSLHHLPSSSRALREAASGAAHGQRWPAWPQPARPSCPRGPAGSSLPGWQGPVRTGLQSGGLGAGLQGLLQPLHPGTGEALGETLHWTQSVGHSCPDAVAGPGPWPGAGGTMGSVVTPGRCVQATAPGAAGPGGAAWRQAGGSPSSPGRWPGPGLRCLGPRGSAEHKSDRSLG